MQEILQSHSLVFRNPPDPPTHRCGSGHHFLNTFSSGCVTVHSGSNCCSLAPLCCPLLSSNHMLCSCLDIHQASLSLSNSTLFPCPVCVTGQLWLPLAISLSAWHQSVLAQVSAHSLTFLRVLPVWTVSSTPSRKSSSTVHLFTLVVAPGPAHAQGNLFGGMMRATTLLLLATALGVTFVALAHVKIRLVSAFCASSFTAQSVPPGPTSGTNGLGRHQCSQACVLSHPPHLPVPCCHS